VGELTSTDTKIKITCTGYSQGKGPDATAEKNPKTLSKTRATTVYNQLMLMLGSPKNVKKVIIGKGNSLSSTNDSATNRRVDVLIENDSTGGKETKNKKEQLSDVLTPQEVQLIDNLLIDESGYFEFIDGNYPTYFGTISEKIKYFHPGFHSTTPEGLNTRLTFLQQCMRQGNSIYDDRDSIQPQNLAFGKPPVCILRIGDFFNTKVIINSLSISYAGGSAIQWDLNPSGIGVQPMMADVTMSIDLIGGHSLLSPINRLQNALSFNYYANTEMYDPRADSVDKSTGEIVPGLKLGAYKNEVLGKEGVDKFYEDLKKEGIVDQQLDAKDTANNTQTNSKGGITIKVSGADTIEVISETTPSEVEFSNGKDPNNLLSVEVEVEKKGVGYTTTYDVKENQNIQVDRSSWANEDVINQDALKKQEYFLLLLQTDLKIEEDSLKDGTYTSTITEVTKTIKTLKRKIKEKEKDIKKIKNEGGDTIKVLAYYTADPKGSRVPKTFTLTGDGLK